MGGSQNFYFNIMSKSLATPSRIFIRVKRQKSIYFFECGSHDNIDSIKKRIVPMYKNVEPTDIRLYLGTRVIAQPMQLLDDKSNIHDQDVRNDSLIHFKFRKPSTHHLIQILANGRKQLKQAYDTHETNYYNSLLFLLFVDLGSDKE